MRDRDFVGFQFTTLKACALLLLTAYLILMNGAQYAIGSQDGSEFRLGWSVILSPDEQHTRYVSSSANSDAPSGSIDNPYPTIARALEDVVGGEHSAVLLKRGDVFYETIQLSRKWGRSPEKPLIIGAYGDESQPRPILKIGAENGINFWTWYEGNETFATRNVVLLSLDVYAQTRDPNSDEFIGTAGGTGLKSIACGGSSYLVEDCRFRFCSIVIDPYSSKIPQEERRIDDFRVNRCGIFDAYADSGHCQGIFLNQCFGFVLTESIFDHNGYNEDVGKNPTVFNHNVYATSYGGPIVAVGNIVAYGASSGIQARAGGRIERNLFVKNACHLNFGFLAGQSVPYLGGVTGTVRRNVFIGSKPVNPNGTGGERAYWSIKLGNIQAAAVTANLAANSGAVDWDGKDDEGRVGVNDTRFRHNVVFGGGARGDSGEFYSHKFSNLGFHGVTLSDNLNASQDAGDEIFDRDGALDGDGIWLRRGFALADYPGFQPMTLSDYYTEGGFSSESDFFNMLHDQRKGAWRRFGSGTYATAIWLIDAGEQLGFEFGD